MHKLNSENSTQTQISNQPHILHNHPLQTSPNSGNQSSPLYYTLHLLFRSPPTTTPSPPHIAYFPNPNLFYTYLHTSPTLYPQTPHHGRGPFCTSLFQSHARTAQSRHGAKCEKIAAPNAHPLASTSAALIDNTHRHISPFCASSDPWS